MAAPQAPQKTQHHELLDSFVGKFRAEVTVWFGNDQSHTSTGTMVNTFHLEGLYLHQDYNGDAPAEGGPTFLGKGYWGYNTTTEQFEGFWIDNASTTMQLEKGTVDDSGTTWTMLSQFIVPGQGVPMDRRTVITLIDEDHHSMETYVTPPGQMELKNMEIRYSRIHD